MATIIPSIGTCVSRMTGGERLDSGHQEGFAWSDLAVLCADWKTMDVCADALV